MAAVSHLTLALNLSELIYNIIHVTFYISFDKNIEGQR